MTITIKDIDGVEYELHEADLLAALGQLSTGSDGPTREDIQSAYDAAYLAAELAGERYPHDDAKRSLYNAGRAEGLAIGEQKQAARVAELESLAYLGDHHFPDLTYKSRCDELQSELAAAKEKRADAQRRVAELRFGLSEVEQERDNLRDAIWNQAGIKDREIERLRSELASARRVVADFIAAGDALFLSTVGVKPDAQMASARVGWKDARRTHRDALASAGTDADRTEAPTDSGKEETDDRRNTESTTIDPERRDARPDGGTRHSGGTHQGPECGPEVASSEPRGHEARGSEHVGSGGDGQGVGTGTGSAGSGESSGLAEPPRPEAGERIAAQARERIATMSSEEVKGLWDKLGSVGGVQEEIPPGFLDARLSSDGKGTLCLGAAGFTTVRACRHCGVLIAGGPTACLSCAQAEEPKPEPPRPEAVESGHDPHHDPECASCGHVASDHRPGSCGACCEDEESGDSAKCDCRRFREEEPKPKPEPQHLTRHHVEPVVLGALPLTLTREEVAEARDRVARGEPQPSGELVAAARELLEEYDLTLEELRNELGMEKDDEELLDSYAKAERLRKALSCP